ncbi:MAG: periplasmic heavy metal sensor [Candidatus Glassbacteria bacterium]|nr:periplasmic heavy metal sensor [Candidatus Glassbacteria bacterium]
MSGIRKFFVELLLVGLVLAPAYAAAAEKQEQAEPGLSEAVDIDELLEGLEVPDPQIGGEALYQIGLAMNDRDEPGPHPGPRDRHEHRIGLFQLWDIMNEVDLTDEQVDKFFPLWREVQKQERTLSGERRELVKELKKELDREKPDEAVLQRLVNMVTAKSEQIWRVRHDGIQQAMQLLTIPQQARFILAVSESERDIFKSIRMVKRGIPALPAFDSGEFDAEMQKFNERMQKYNERMQKYGEEMQEWSKEYNKSLEKKKEKDKKPESGGKK